MYFYTISIIKVVAANSSFTAFLRGYVPEGSFPEKAVEKAANKKKPLIPPNSMIGQFTAVLGTAVLGTAFLE